MRLMRDEFASIFFPLAFDVQLRVTIADPRYRLEAVYGSPSSDEIQLANGDWSASYHSLYPPDFRRMVECLLLSALASGCARLPREVLSLVLSHVGASMQRVCSIDTIFPSSNRAPAGLLVAHIRRDPSVEIGDNEAPSLAVGLHLMFKDELGANRFSESLMQVPLCIESGQSASGPRFSSSTSEKAYMMQQFVFHAKRLIDNQLPDARDQATSFVAKYRAFGRKLNEKTLIEDAKTMEDFLRNRPVVMRCGCICM